MHSLKQWSHLGTVCALAQRMQFCLLRYGSVAQAQLQEGSHSTGRYSVRCVQSVRNVMHFVRERWHSDSSNEMHGQIPGCRVCVPSCIPCTQTCERLGAALYGCHRLFCRL